MSSNRLRVLQIFRNNHEPLGPYTENGRLTVREALSQDGVVVDLIDPHSRYVMSGILSPDEARSLLENLGKIVNRDPGAELV